MAQQLPENWNTLTHNEKDLWFARNCMKYTREGEVAGLMENLPEDIQEEYQKFIVEKSA